MHKKKKSEISSSYHFVFPSDSECVESCIRKFIKFVYLNSWLFVQFSS